MRLKVDAGARHCVSVRNFWQTHHININIKHLVWKQRELLQVMIASANRFSPRFGGQQREVYDAVFLICSCGLLAFGHGDRPCQRLSGRDTSRVRVQRRCSFQLPLRVVFAMRPGLPSEPGCFQRKPALTGMSAEDHSRQLCQVRSMSVNKPISDTPSVTPSQAPNVGVVNGRAM
jgi:hypothetical protein